MGLVGNVIAAQGRAASQWLRRLTSVPRDGLRLRRSAGSPSGWQGHRHGAAQLPPSGEKRNQPLENPSVFTLPVRPAVQTFSKMISHLLKLIF